jgi:phosphoribosylglycinamide formyltransferase-1
MSPMKKIVLFASGSGTNAENIIRYFSNQNQIKVAAVFTNNPQAGVIDRAQKLDVQTVVFSRDELNSGVVLRQIHQIHPDLIVLAGFLLMFPKSIISEYTTINIHPALLPKYGGKGMYGTYVHQAVLDNHEDFTGITIHYVNEQYDDGAIIFQKEVSVVDCTSVDEIAQKVHLLEYEYFPTVIESVLKSVV